MVSSCNFVDLTSPNVNCRILGIVETDVLRLKLPGMEIVVLSSTQAISDLLDRRSAIYSDKVRVPRRVHWVPTIHNVPLPAVHSDDRVVSSFDRWLVTNLISPSLRDAGWEPANILCLLCLTGHDGALTGSYLTILSTFQRPRTTISTRSNRCQVSS